MSCSYQNLLKLGDEEWAREAKTILNFLRHHPEVNKKIKQAWIGLCKDIIASNPFINPVELTVLLGEILFAYQVYHEDRAIDTLDIVAAKAKELAAIIKSSGVNYRRLLSRYKLVFPPHRNTPEYHFKEFDHVRMNNIMDTLKELSVLAEENHRPPKKKKRNDHVYAAIFKIADYWEKRWKQRDLSRDFVKEGGEFVPINDSSKLCYKLIIFVEKMKEYKNINPETFAEDLKKSLRSDSKIASRVKSAMESVISVRRKNAGKTKKKAVKKKHVEI